MNKVEKNKKWTKDKENIRVTWWSGISLMDGVTSGQMESLQEHETLSIRFWLADVIVNQY